MDPRGRLSMDDVRNRTASLLHIIGPRSATPRDAVILMANAAWDASAALRQFRDDTRPGLQPAMARIQNLPSEG